MHHATRPLHYFFLIPPRPPTSTLFPYTTLFRSLKTTRCASSCIRNRCSGASYNSMSTSYEESGTRSEEHTSELQSPDHLVCRLLLEKKNRTRLLGFS